MATTFDQIIDDISAFSDLGTQPDVVRYKEHIEVRWTRHKISYYAEVRRVRSKYEVRYENGQRLSYSQFLAGLADLDELASKIILMASTHRRRSARRIRGMDVYPFDWYVDSFVVDPYATQTERVEAMLALQTLVDDPLDDAATQVVFLTAQAGQGKSLLLQRFNTVQAERYRSRKSSRLTFYVDAQGRGLAQLNEAIALRLNELDISIPHAGIPVLVREGLVVLIVDGFDELIGSRGSYDDAYSSLSTFLHQLDGRGKFVAAARSTYFAQQYANRVGLLRGAGLGGVAYSLQHLRLCEWTDREKREFASVAQKALGERGKGLTKQFERVLARDDTNVMGRPLFCRDVVLLLTEGETAAIIPTDGQNLVRVISDGIIERETRQKLLDSSGRQLVPPTLLREYFEQLAGEMWDLETREVDDQSARALMEVLLEDAGVSGEAFDIVTGRLAFLALLAVGRRRDLVEFEHELFFGHFLSGKLAADLMELAPVSVRTKLSRAALDSDTAAEMSRELLRDGAKAAPSVLERLSEVAGGRHPRQTQVRMNCGAIAAAYLRAAGSILEPVSVRWMTFAGVDMAGVDLRNAEFENVEMYNVDLRGAVVRGRAANLTIREPSWTPGATTIDLSGFDPIRDLVGVRLVAPEAVRTVHNPREYLPLLGLGGSEEEVDGALRWRVGEKRLHVVERLCHAFERMNPVGSKHEYYQDVFASSDWKKVRRAMLDTGLIREDQRGVSGPSQEFFRKHFDPQELLAGLAVAPSDPRVDEFWRQIAIDPE